MGHVDLMGDMLADGGHGNIATFVKFDGALHEWTKQCALLDASKELQQKATTWHSTPPACDASGETRETNTRQCNLQQQLEEQ